MGVNDEVYQANASYRMRRARRCLAPVLGDAADIRYRKGDDDDRALIYRRSKFAGRAAQRFAPSARAAQNIITANYDRRGDCYRGSSAEIRGKFDGLAIRVPTSVVSLTDFTFVLGRDVTEEEVNAALEAASKSDRFKGILEVTNEPLVPLTSSAIRHRRPWIFHLPRWLAATSSRWLPGMTMSGAIPSGSSIWQ